MLSIRYHPLEYVRVRACLRSKALAVGDWIIFYLDWRAIKFLAGLIAINFMPYLNTMTKPISGYKMDLFDNPSYPHSAFFLVVRGPYCDGYCYGVLYEIN